MHVPDGLLNAPTSIGAGIIAGSIIALGVRRAPTEMGDRTAPLAGLLAAGIFAVQLLSFPIAGGTGAHLLGGTLAAVLIGPFTGLVCASVVELVQSLMFADGGITGLGASIICMDIVPIFIGYSLFLVFRRALPKTSFTLVIASSGAAFFSVIAGATAFVLLYAIGGATDIPFPTVASGVIGAHVIIAGIEAAVTAIALRAVLARRPDLLRAESLAKTT